MYKLKNLNCIKLKGKVRCLKAELKSLQAVLNLTIDDSVFIFLENLFKNLAPKNPNVFLPVSDFTFGSKKL